MDTPAVDTGQWHHRCPIHHCIQCPTLHIAVSQHDPHVGHSLQLVGLSHLELCKYKDNLI